MPNFPFYKWFKNVSIANKLYSVVGIMAVLIAVELGTLYFAVNTLSSVRAFVGAEGLWSKSQKDAVYHLQQYSQTHNEDDEQAFYHFMKVPLGYRKTLLELKKANVDLDVARQGLLEGGSHPDDIDGMIKLFRRFEDNSYIHESINIWAEADSTVAKLIPIAKKLHAEINLPTGQAGSPSPTQNKLDEITQQIEPINQKLTILEDDFSYTLGEGARWLENIVLKILLAIAVTVELSGLILTYFVVRGISKGLKEIMNASKSIAQRDFSVRAKVFSNDEIGLLAKSFNHMTAELSNSIQKQIQSSQDLEVKTKFIEESERRIFRIMDALTKTTQFDFSEKLTVSDRADELDVIAAGLNTMSEELEYHLQQLKQSEEKLNDAQRLAKIGNWEMDMATNKVHWSNEMFNVYGYGNERFEVSFEKALERMLPEDAQRTKARTKKQVEDAIQSFNEKNTLEFQNDPITYTLVLPDGSRKVVQGIGKIILNTNGQVTKMVGTVQDITERDKAEKKLNQYNIELEIKNKELESFTYITSHDLQEPLRKIQLFAERIVDSEYQRLSDKGKDYFKRMQNAATKMRLLIKDLLAYSHANTSQDDQEYINLNDIVEDVKLEFSETIAEKDAIIEVRELGELRTFHFQIRQLVHNLIGNSLKFSRPGHQPHIRIESEFKRGKDLLNENLITGTNYCHLKFEDNGIGFKKEYHEKIFDVFQRLHGSNDYSGSGIGLAIVKKIVENHNGVITASSSIDQGAIFDIYIPAD